MTQEIIKPTKAVIYCRVSSVKQVEEGHGLESQETRCREFAARNGYHVVETFYDKGVSGGLTERPGVMTMLAFLKKHTCNDEFVVIIDDISRLARDIRAHHDLRLAIMLAGGKLESPSVEFGEDSDSILVENLLASVSQHQRQKNGEQTRNRMRARVMNGYWVFHAPPGYKYAKVDAHGKMLVRNEPLASIVQEGLEGFASGRFESQGELKRFFERHPEFPMKMANGELRYETVIRLLTRPHYAGYIEVPEWGVSLRKGHHEGLISLETYQAIQRRINEEARAPARRDINADFPLRGFILCDDCQKPLTACWSTSKTGKKHPYYLCFNKDCGSYRKSIPRARLEGEFEKLLRSLRPAASLFRIARSMFNDAWEQRRRQTGAIAEALRNEITKTESDIEQLLNRIVEARRPSVVAAYERQIEKLERHKLVSIEKLNKAGQPPRSFDEMFELAMKFLVNPWKLWDSGCLNLRRTVLRLAFVDRIAYDRNQGLRTPETTLPFKVLEQISNGKCDMADGEGFEPSIGD